MDLNNIRSASRIIAREYGLLNGICRELNISYSKGHCLLELERKKQLTASELSRLLNLNRSTTSRIIKQLLKEGSIEISDNIVISREMPVKLTEKGLKKIALINSFANNITENAVKHLTDSELKKVTAGLKVFSNALLKERFNKNTLIRKIRKGDENNVKSIVLSICHEFSTLGSGGPSQDKELDSMYKDYSNPGNCYFVLEYRKAVIGGAGIALHKTDQYKACELRKMYLLPEARGLGFGGKLLSACINEAKKLNYEYLYIETIHRMKAARKLYLSAGAKKLKGPLGDTGHHQSECWYLLKL
jgi:putative acetyltransferase